MVKGYPYHCFRHDNRKLKDCYIEGKLREQHAIDLKTHPLRQLLKFTDETQNHFKEAAKIFRKLERDSKMWQKTVGEGGYDNEGVMFKSSIEVISYLMEEIQSLFTLRMVETLLKLNGEEFPPEIKTKIEEYRRSRKELINNPFVVNLLNNVLKGGIKDFYQLEMKYNFADKKRKKDEWKQKLRDAW